MKGLTFFGHDDITLNNTVDADDQNNSTFKSTTYEHQFEENITTLSVVNHAGQDETYGGHQCVIFWVLLGLCVLFCAWLCFIFRRKFWHRIVHLCPFPKSQSNYTVERLTIMGPKEMSKEQRGHKCSLL